ncbi:MAG: class I SAM-dependent methyltransferase [Planctomycetota bacterium]|nr:class I SAM-dependent methyltransferase [Planctomycetota bacterium]MDA1114674.1 class I SAM-dependent methyltransferase [Planctomycetota bacterium]
MIGVPVALAYPYSLNGTYPQAEDGRRHGRTHPLSRGEIAPHDLGALYLLCHLDLQAVDVFLDLGCGKGRVTCMASRSNASRVVGLEQDDALLEIARKNLNRISDVRAQVDFHHGLAQDFDFDTTTVVFLFNPFGADTLRDVLHLLEQSLKRNPRRLRIVYVNPVHEQVLSNADWLSNTHSWPSAAYPEFEIQPPNLRLVSFWEAKA